MSSETKNTVTWVACGLTGLLFIASGVGKFSGSQQLAEQFGNYGLSVSLLSFVGAAELAGGLGLLLPPLATLAASGLSIIMVGAVFLHLSHGEASHVTVPLVLLGLTLSIAQARRGALGRFLHRGAAHPAH